MAKAKKVEITKEIESPYMGTSAKDLSIEKRVELFNSEYEKFKVDMENTFGLKIDVELVYHPKGTVPRVVLVDLLKNNEQTKESK